MRLPCLLRIALSVALASAATVHAQPGGVYLVGVADRAQFDEAGLGVFAETYSEYYSGRIAKPLAPFPGEAQALGAGGLGRIRLGRVAVGVGYTYLRRPEYDETADLDGVAQRFSLEVWDHTTWLEVTVNAGPIFVGGVMNVLVRGERLRARTIYADGSESLGSEYLLNGVYHGTTSANEFGVVAGLALGNRIVIPVRLYLTRFVPAEDSFSDPLDDDDLYEFNSAFPRDFSRYLDDRRGLDFGNALGGNEFLGGRIQVSVELRLF